ncbi:hypothetical protein LGH83_13280 [Lichenihabitans sp. PAMC28606]|uniref:hypothetical protein n=1 Tax=Lichenihabitans sp. PAMC28606 TaxID=2880932 RepID=UPI001D0A4EB8|nr:hypothetical protein [Lichenihabitans sp. PAMC28606]UDL93550.1 hypothetical protein LGH83_13280 [Lichenihabitans sp. PAMC28606]
MPRPHWTRRLAKGVAALRPVRRAAPLAPPERGPPPPPALALSQRLSYRLQNSRYAAGPKPAQTLATLVHLEAEPVFVRLMYVNDDPEPWTIDGAAVAATSALGNGVDPLNAAGDPDPSLWRPVTFQAKGRDSQPLDLIEGGDTTLTLPGNRLDVGRPVHALSDWVPLRALSRRDGGSGWLLLVRTFSHGSIRFAASVGLPDPAVGLLHRGFSADGDQTIPATSGRFERDDTLFACHGVQFITPVAGATVIGIGDSIIHSSCTSGEVSGFGIRACTAISRLDRPVSYVNEGFPGRNSLGFSTNGLWAIETLRPQIAIIQAWTRNEAWTADQADIAFGRAMAMADAARRVGCVPILTTAPPVFHDNSAGEAVRCAANARVRAAADSGMLLLDIDALWRTESTPAAYRPEYDASDQTHPNNLACAVAAEALAPMLLRILG